MTTHVVVKVGEKMSEINNKLDNSALDWRLTIVTSNGLFLLNQTEDGKTVLTVRIFRSMTALYTYIRHWYETMYFIGY